MTEQQHTPGTDLAVRTPAPIRAADTDSWVQIVGSVATLAGRICNTPFVPKGLRGSDAATAAAMLYGRELGLPPMTSLRSIDVIDGRPAASAEAMRALVLAQGHEIETTEASGVLVRMRGRRRGSETWTELTWTIDMARAAGLLSKDNWKGYPRAMLTARVTTELCRLVFPDVLHGLTSIEEARDLDDQEPQVEESTTTVRRGGPTAGRGRAVKPAKAPPRAITPAAPPESSEAVMPLPGEDGYADLPGGDAAGAVVDSPTPPSGTDTGTDEGEVEESRPDSTPDEGDDTVEGDVEEPAVVEPPEDAPVVEDRPRPGPISRAQGRMLMARMGELGIPADEAEEQRRVFGMILGRTVESRRTLTADDGHKLLDTLTRVDTLADLFALLDGIEAARGEGS